MEFVICRIHANKREEGSLHINEFMQNQLRQMHSCGPSILIGFIVQLLNC